jgi:serine/threonine-protein kinase
MQAKKYKVLRPLRTMPGNVTVFDAEQTALGRRVEIRVLNQFVGKDSDTYLRFEREFKTIARLDHPHCIKIFDWGHADDKIFYVAERRPAVPLDELMSEEKRPPPRDILLIGSQIGEALAYLHSQSIVHRDIGLSSVYWAPRKRIAFIAHFTMVKNLKLEDLTAKGVGHVAPLAFTPEENAGEKIDERTDIFLLGSLIYKLLTGQEPVPIEQVLGNPDAEYTVPVPSQLNTVVEASVDSVLLKALARDPGERYQDAGEFAAALRAQQERLEQKRTGRTSRTAAIKKPQLAPASPGRSEDLPSAVVEPSSTALSKTPSVSPEGPGEGALRAAGLGPLVDKMGAGPTWGLVVGLGLGLALLVSLLL